MAAGSNKITIRVKPNRRNENIVFSTTGHFGSTRLNMGPIYMNGEPLTAATDAKLYWTVILESVKAKLLSL